MFSLFLFQSFVLVAEEGGSGHYMPGSMSSFVDGVPPSETFIVRLNVLEYDGNYALALPFANLQATNIDVKTKAVGLTMLYRPDIDLGDNWSYAFSTTIPYVDMDVTANVSTTLGTFRRNDLQSGIGDIVIMPIMLNQTVSPDLSFNYRLALYAPTGSYEVGELANTGKNFWTVEPTAAAMYFNQENGIEASLFFGVDFNQKNDDTQYKSGAQGHIDGTIAQHLPLWGGLAGIGLSGFYYKQLNGDSGEGAIFGDFKARSVGAGPVFSYVHQGENSDFLAEIKWLHEFTTDNRVQGDTIFLKVIWKI